MELARGILLVLLALVATVTIVNGDDSSSDGTPTTSDATSLEDTVNERMVAVIQNTLLPGERRFVIMQQIKYEFMIVPLICNGSAAIVSHTPSFPNNECWRIMAPTLANNLSCTCLTPPSPDEWTFKFRRNTRTVEEEMVPALTLTTEDVIEIDSTMMYGVDDTVKSVVFEGVGDSPVDLTVIKSPAPVDTNANIKFIYKGASKFTSLVIRNINFITSSPIQTDFVPNTLQDLTISSCNIEAIDPGFMSTFPSLTSLDLSNNLISEFAQNDLEEESCQTCLYTSINLSNNMLEEIPSELLRLKYLTSLDLTGNSIKNLTIDVDTYNSLNSINQLKLDFTSSFSGNCSSGTLQTLSAAQVCVLNDPNTVPTVPNDPPEPSVTASADSDSSSYLVYVVIGGCLIIAVLVFLLVKNKLCPARDKHSLTKEPFDSYFDNTLAYEDTHATISASLLNDPIIITNRLPYKDLRVANCISKGGFGLVYSGVYNRRRVAIKKIRPDRAGDIKQIESFLKEICLIATLNHPRIVEFIGVSWDTLRNLCAVTEFMERGDLREVLQGFKLRNKALSWESHKTTIALHIAEGLTYLHSLSPKIVHRDLKSKNVLVNGEMVAKLSDFGISRERHIEETHMTAGIGTSFWIAPEVLLGKDYDERADIFSFGVVLSEIDTDDYPYWNASNPNVGNKAQESMILQMVASGAMRPSFSDACPQAILELADLCLEVDPQKRPTAAEVAYKLQQIVQFMNVPSTSMVSSRRAM